MAWFDAGDRLQEGRGPSLNDPLVDAKGNPKPGATWKVDSGRHHADDGVALSVEADHLPDDLAVRTEVFAPDPIRDHHYRRRAHVFIGGGKVAAYHGRDPEDTEEVMRHWRAFNLDGFA